MKEIAKLQKGSFPIFIEDIGETQCVSLEDAETAVRQARKWSTARSWFVVTVYVLCVVATMLVISGKL